jgi:Peptidase family M28
VENIVAVKPGAKPEAIALVAHYDSVPFGPGGSDNALGAAVVVEAGRALAASGVSQHSLLVLITDGEEAGLLGAAAAAVDRDVAYRIAAYLNVDSIGSSGPSHMFEAGPGNGWIVQAWARAAPRPRGASFAADIYRRLPNDTDFSMLKKTGAPGLNFSPIGDSYAYHTPRDTAERLSDETIRQTGENIVAVAERLDRMDLSRRTSDQLVYFDVARRFAIAYGPITSTIITIGALVAGLLGWFRVALESARLAGPGRLAMAAFWANAGLFAAFAAMTLAAAALRASREALHPWYAHPERFFILLVAAGGACAWAASRVGILLPERWHGVRHPALIWTIALPVWIVIAGVTSVFAPLSAFLWTLPLAAAGILLLTLPTRSVAAMRAAAVVVFVVVALLWLDNLAALAWFMVAVLGRQPVITPVWIYPAILTLGAMVLAPPAIAALVRQRRLLHPAVGTSAALLAIACAFAWAWMAPAYTEERPLRRVARYIDDAPGGTAFWEIGGVEPGLDLGDGAPAGWTPAAEQARTSVPLPPLAHPFVFRRPVDPSEREPPPAEVTMTIEADGGVTLRVRPAEFSLFVSFVLPDRPVRASLPGTFRRGRWAAHYDGIPPEGVAFTAALKPGDRPDTARVVLVRTGGPLPSGSPLPRWLASERTAWETTSTWIVAPRQPLR